MNAESLPVAVGIAYQPWLSPWLESRPAGIDLVEISAEGFAKGAELRLRRLRGLFPLAIHASRLSLGSPTPEHRAELPWMSALVSAADPLWVSDHLGFCRAGEVDLGVPTPIALTAESLARVTEHVQEVMATLRRPLLVENIAYLLEIGGTMSEPEFLGRLCEATGCGLLLDLAALVVNGRNHAFHPRRWLAELPLRHVTQLHVSGYRVRHGRWLDARDGTVPGPILELAARVVRDGAVRAVVLEWQHGLPGGAVIVAEVARLRAVVGA